MEVLVQGHLKEELEALLTGDERLSSHVGVKNANYNIPQGVIKVRKNIIDIYDDDDDERKNKKSSLDLTTIVMYYPH